MAVTLSKLAEISGGELIAGEQGTDLEVTDITLDSNEVTQGAMFAALPGTRQHGATFAAVTSATAILTDHAGKEILDAAGEKRPILVVEDIRTVLGIVAAEIFDHPSKKLTIIEIGRAHV